MKSWRTVWWKLLALIARQCAKRKKKFSQRLHNWFNCTKKNIFSYFIFKSHVCDWFDSSAKLVGILFIFIKQKLFIIFLTPICARDEKEKSSRSMIARVLIGIDRCRHAWKFFFALSQSRKVQIACVKFYLRIVVAVFALKIITQNNKQIFAICANVLCNSSFLFFSLRTHAPTKFIFRT